MKIKKIIAAAVAAAVFAVFTPMTEVLPDLLSVKVNAAGYDENGFIIEDGVLVDVSEDLTHAVVPEGVIEIAEEAFDKCSKLISITIPASVTRISADFYHCYNLESINVDADNEYYVSIDGILYRNGWDSLELLECPKNKKGDIIIPDSFYYSDIDEDIYVTGIYDFAFSSCKRITSVHIPDSVVWLGRYVFSNCENLKSVNIPAVYYFKEIPDEAFNGCSSLTNITIPDNITNIGKGAFAYCSSLESITIPDSVTELGVSAFEGCSNLKNITLSNGLTEIYGGLFSHCKNLTLTIPDSVTKIRGYVFEECDNLTVTIPSSVTEIDETAFAYSKNVTIIAPPGSYADNFAKKLNESSNAAAPVTTAATTAATAAPVTTAATTAATAAPVVTTASTAAPVTAAATTTAENTAAAATETTTAADVTTVDDNKPFEYTDEETKASVSAETGVIPEGAELQAASVADENTDTRFVYDLSFTKDGSEIQPEGDVTVTLPVPEEFVGKTVNVYREEGDGSFTNMNAKENGGFLTFTTDHFSRYIVTTENLDVTDDAPAETTEATSASTTTAAPETTASTTPVSTTEETSASTADTQENSTDGGESGTGLVVGIVIVVVLAAGAAAIVVYKKKKK